MRGAASERLLTAHIVAACTDGRSDLVGVALISLLRSNAPHLHARVREHRCGRSSTGGLIPLHSIWSPQSLTPPCGFPAKSLSFIQMLQVFRGTWRNITVAVKVSKLASEWGSACCETVAEQAAWLAAHPFKHMPPAFGQFVCRSLRLL